MKFLCLPGAYGSAKLFQVQLGPFVDEVEKRGIAGFHWTQGTNPAIPPKGFENYFGEGPLFRFIDFDGLGTLDILDKIRDFPAGIGPEETMRRLMGADSPYIRENVEKAMDALFRTIEGDGEVEGILGYSEGATTAATLILEEKRLFELTGRPRRIKCAIFLAGWPPLSLASEGEAKVVLADECDDKIYIDVPTLHIVGANDPYVLGCMALYNMCDADSAELFDHGKGHTVPRDARTIGELSESIRRVVQRRAE